MVEVVRHRLIWRWRGWRPSQARCLCGAQLGTWPRYAEADFAYVDHLRVVDGLQKLLVQVLPEVEAEILAADISAKATT